ncbi:MAG TPA: alpha/beta fold hydrolase, partial [Candidatus Dormibacteraeota bacterium]|nr:alpha/beta fold hydrolase [Candidatus Dormibacteraeota bacterium]
VALNHPKRALTLTSIFSGPGGVDEVRPTEQGLAVLLAPPQPTREARIEQALWGRKATAGRLDPFDEEFEYARAARAFDRAYYPAGYTRQWMAIISAPSRLQRLKSLTVPTLVIHGLDDIVIPPENGRIVAAAVPRARLMEIEGMGHQLPERVWAQIADAIAQLARKAVTSC